MSNVSRNRLGVYVLFPAPNVRSWTRSQKPTEIGTETVDTETASGIMALPTERRLVKTLLTTSQPIVESEKK